VPVTPYLSIVVAARNDNYGGEFLHRMQVFVNSLLAQAEIHKLHLELIIVEWNPPADRPRLGQVVKWPKLSSMSKVCIVEVPQEIHERLPRAKTMPMFEYIAKNVGIRRAAGQFVLATNPDIVFSEKIIRRLAAAALKEDSFYRANRYDVAEEIPLDQPVRKQLKLCDRRAFRLHCMEGTIPRRHLVRLRNYLAQNLYRLTPSLLVRSALRQIRRVLPASTPSAAAQVHARASSMARAPSPLMLHTNASGDFLLMSAKHWRALRGYPELPTHSHIDSYMVYLAAIAGLHQNILCDSIYHQEHDRSEQSARPQTVLDDIPALREMLETRRPIVTNGEHWGLGDLELQTVRIS
jgi:hypothetical protein